jgi:hypothetical protein
VLKSILCQWQELQFKLSFRTMHRHNMFFMMQLLPMA